MKQPKMASHHQGQVKDTQKKAAFINENKIMAGGATANNKF